jgi:hypothetical protein
VSSQLHYYEVYGPAMQVIALFLDRAEAERYAAITREEILINIEEKVRLGSIVTAGERKGEIDYATHGVNLRRVSLEFLDGSF